jgi:putative transposase
MSDIFGASVARQWFAGKPQEGRKFRILAVTHDGTRKNLGLIADTSLSGARVARELTAMIRIYRQHGCIVSDNGTEFTRAAILK